jgi:hypothetical protein
LIYDRARFVHNCIEPGDISILKEQVKDMQLSALNIIKNPDTKKDLEKITTFHGYLSSGAFIGYQMIKIANSKNINLIFTTAYLGKESDEFIKNLTKENYEKFLHNKLANKYNL